MEEKKSRYTEAQKKSANKYLKEKVEDIRIRVPKGQKQIIKDYADRQGKSLNQFIVDLINQEIEKMDNEEKDYFMQSFYANPLSFNNLSKVGLLIFNCSAIAFLVIWRDLYFS